MDWGAAPSLNLSIRWKWTVKLHTPCAFPPISHWTSSWVGPSTGLDVLENKIISWLWLKILIDIMNATPMGMLHVRVNLLPLQGTEIQFSRHPPYSIITIMSFSNVSTDIITKTNSIHTGTRALEARFSRGLSLSPLPFSASLATLWNGLGKI